MNKDLLFENYPFLVKDNLTLAKIQPSQANPLIELMNDDDYVRYSPYRPEYNDYNIHDLYRKIDALFKAKQSVWFGISSDDDVHTLDGVIIVKDFDVKTDSCTIDFNFSSEIKDSAETVDAIKFILDYMFNQIEISRIKAVCLPQYTWFKNLLEKCGFILEGTSRNGDYWEGHGVVSVSYYSLLRSDFPKAEPVTEPNEQ